MPDDSYLDRKYFIDADYYNCPYCNRNRLPFTLTNQVEFDWKSDKKCYAYFVKCHHCENVSMHLSYEDIAHPVYEGGMRRPEYITYYNFEDELDDIDSKLFYSVPTSFFVMDDRIPRIIRELITEAEGSLKMNFLTGASACIRKALICPYFPETSQP